MERSFQALCDSIEAQGPESNRTKLIALSKAVMPALDSLGNGKELLASIVISAVIADGELSEKEYDLSHPFFDVLFGDQVSYAECKKLAQTRDAATLKDSVDKFIDACAAISDGKNDLKTYLTLCCIYACAIDGKITRKERKFLQTIFD